MMKKSSLLFMVVCFMSACTSTQTQGENEWVGGVLGGNVNYIVKQKSLSEFDLKASTGQVVTLAQLKDTVKNKANQLCAPKIGDYVYEIEVSKYNQYKRTSGVVYCK